MSEKTIKNWVALAEYDFETAGAMLKANRYLYVVFTCQQCVEKIMKAFYVIEHKKTPPYTHNLFTLLNELSFGKEVLQLYSQLFEDLNSYYIESRYAETLQEISKELTKENAAELYTQTGALFQWFKARM